MTGFAWLGSFMVKSLQEHAMSVSADVYQR
jgi:hypothetical protein